jgi:hypothetical protein
MEDSYKAPKMETFKELGSTLLKIAPKSYEILKLSPETPIRFLFVDNRNKSLGVHLLYIKTPKENVYLDSDRIPSGEYTKISSFIQKQLNRN